MMSFGVAQIVHMSIHGTQGLSTSAFLLSGLFVSLRLKLAYAAHHRTPSKETLKILWMYWLAVVLYLGIMTVLVVKSHRVWDAIDTLTIIITIASTLVSLIWLRELGIKFKDPLTDGVCTLIVKVVPSTLMAWKIWHEGGSGLSFGLVVVYHVMILLEVLQVSRAAIATSWNKHIKALFVATIGNEISWILVTIAWLM